MGLIFKGSKPNINGDLIMDIPTPTYSGKKSNDALDSINPYTSYGLGGFNLSLTENQILSERDGILTDPYFYQVTLLMQPTEEDTDPIYQGGFRIAGIPGQDLGIDGRIFDFRITDGIVRYTSNFDTLIAPFPIQ